MATMEKERLYEIIANHGKWLRDEGGERANLIGADLHEAVLYDACLRKAELRGANLHGADLCHTDLHGANLRYTNLCQTDLSYADLRHANLFGAYLCKADLRGTCLEGANLVRADLWGAKLPTGMYQIVGAGSCNRCTTYDSINDQVICGCWYDGKGNHLDSFIKRIEEVYGIDGESPNQTYYTEYMSAVAFFKAMEGCVINTALRG